MRIKNFIAFNEMGKNDVDVQAIMKAFKEGSPERKKEIAKFICYGDEDAKEEEILKELIESTHTELIEIMKILKITW